MDINNGFTERRDEELIQVKSSLECLERQADRNTKMIENLNKMVSNFMGAAAGIKNDLPWDLPLGRSVGKVRTVRRYQQRPDWYNRRHQTQNDETDELPDLVPSEDPHLLGASEDAKVRNFLNNPIPDDPEDARVRHFLDNPIPTPPRFIHNKIVVAEADTSPETQFVLDNEEEHLEDAQRLDDDEADRNDLSTEDVIRMDDDNAVADYNMMPPPPPPTTPCLSERFDSFSAELRREIGKFKRDLNLEDVVYVRADSPNNSLFNISPVNMDDEDKLGILDTWAPKTLEEVFAPDEDHLKIWKFKNGTKFYEVPKKYLVVKE